MPSPMRRLIRSDSPPGESSRLWRMSETAPFQVPICAYLFLIAVVNLASNFGITPRSVDDAYESWLIIPWELSLLVGTGLALIGRYKEAFRVESTGLAFLVVASGIYVFAVFKAVGWGGTFAALGYLAIVTGCAIRMRVIARHHKAQIVAAQILTDENNHNHDKDF
jgi:hypothetical protein